VGHFRKRLKKRITIKNLIYLSLLLVQIACKGNGQEANEPPEKTVSSEQPAIQQDTQKRPQDQKKTQDFSKQQEQNRSEKKSDKIYGIKMKGRFRLYTHFQASENSKDVVYEGPPKIEILNKRGNVIKSYDVIKNQEVIKGYDSVSAFGLGRNEYKFQHKSKRKVLEFVNTEHFGIPDPSPFLLMRVEYSYNNGVLWIKNNVFATDGFRVYGGKTEVIGLDTLGSEIHRQIVDGWGSGFSVDLNNRYYAIKTGGLATEAVEYFNPMRMYLIDLDSGIIFSHYQESGCIRGGGFDYPYLVFSVTSSINCDYQKLIKICALDFHNNKMYYIEKDIISKNNYYYSSRFGGYIEWQNPDSLEKMYYSKHFQVKTIK